MTRIGILVGKHIQVAWLYEDAYWVYHRSLACSEAAEIILVDGYSGCYVLSGDDGGTVLRYEFHVVFDVDDRQEFGIGYGVDVGTPLRVAGRCDNDGLGVVVVVRGAVAFVGNRGMESLQTTDV